MEEEKQQKLFDNRKLAALLIPLAVDQLLNSFMGTVDTLVVSNLGSAAISAVSLVDSINILIVQAFSPLQQAVRWSVPIIWAADGKTMQKRRRDSSCSLHL